MHSMHLAPQEGLMPHRVPRDRRLQGGLLVILENGLQSKVSMFACTHEREEKVTPVGAGSGAACAAPFLWLRGREAELRRPLFLYILRHAPATAGRPCATWVEGVATPGTKPGQGALDVHGTAARRRKPLIPTEWPAKGAARR